MAKHGAGQLAQNGPRGKPPPVARSFARPSSSLPSSSFSSQRRRLLSAAPLQGFTNNSLTTFDAVDTELDKVREQGYAFDNEEFLPGLLCLGVLVPSRSGNSNMGLAVQAPIMRFSKEKALSHLAKLQAAAEAIARINDDVPPGADDD